MPEHGETVASEYTGKRWLEKVKDDPLLLHAIWVDATDKEIITMKSNPRVQQGLTFQLQPGVRCKHGANHAQQSVYPPLSDNGIPSLQSLSLRGITSAPRTIILDFGKLWLQVRCFIFEYFTPLILSFIGSVDNPYCASTLHTRAMG